MQLKLKKKFKFGQMFKDIKEDFSKAENRRAFKTLLQETIYSGISPVAGKRFKNYTKEYGELKGKKSPVDMTVTGDMLDSINIESKNEGKTLLIKFTDEKAKYHDKLGAGKSKIIRRLLQLLLFKVRSFITHRLITLFPTLRFIEQSFV